MFSLQSRTEPEVLCLSVFSLSFPSSPSPSLDLPCFLELVTSSVSIPFLCPARHPPLTAFTICGEAIQLRKCCETSDSTSCSNQYISGPADTHPQLRMHTCFSTPRSLCIALSLSHYPSVFLFVSPAHSHTPGVISHSTHSRRRVSLRTTCDSKITFFY